MPQALVARFGFRIRTRMGIVVDVVLPGRDEAEAYRKLNQIYRECELIGRISVTLPMRGGGSTEPRAAALR
jgi:hypothetical protein